MEGWFSSLFKEGDKSSHFPIVTGGLRVAFVCGTRNDHAWGKTISGSRLSLLSSLTSGQPAEVICEPFGFSKVVVELCYNPNVLLESVAHISLHASARPNDYLTPA
jgi:hypothetical protein